MIDLKNQKIQFTKPLLIYIPAYNCEKYIVSVLDEIPSQFWDIADILIVDNCSTDKTLANIQQARSENRWPKPINVIQPERNLGYSGSQKLAYSLAIKSKVSQKIIMLHGDGQYPPELLDVFSPHIESDYDLVYGFRDKSAFPDLEETPAGTYRIIKALSGLESFVTGHSRKEWHTGFVMYSCEFLKQIDFDALTDTYHIDGHLQFVSGEFKSKVKALSIWKRYKNYEQLKGLNRITYIFHVLRLMVQFRLQGFSKLVADSTTVHYQPFTVIAVDPTSPLDA
jgi:glycosyltransferase involved in cell wall biosynthesis